MFYLKVNIITSLLTIITATNRKLFEFSLSPSSYDDIRKTIISDEESRVTGGNLNLTRKEMIVNDIFMRFKQEELEEGIRNSNHNVAGMHFFKAKPLIDRSIVFKIIKKMPKGALLNTHTLAAVSSEWVVNNILYMDGLIRCGNKHGQNILTFRKQSQKNGCTTQYVNINQERKNNSSPERYDRSLERLINLEMSFSKHDSANKVWRELQNISDTILDALLYIEAYRLYFKQMLEELYNDNIMYAEVRQGFYHLYDIGGQLYPLEQSVIEMINIEVDFKRQHGDFLGIKIICTSHRNAEPDVVRQHFDAFRKLHSIFPSHIIGFDLVGREDLVKPLHYFADILTKKPETTNYFFHAGESNSYGGSAYLNLIDAMFFNTTRIGHGYALVKHPVLWNLVKQRDIAVEVSPISNQVLHLVSDLRNPPGSFFIAHNIPMVICNDSPGFWNAKALSYDFYYTIMSLAPNYGGLKILKQLVWNSIKYSMLDDKQLAYNLLEKQWDHFLDNSLNEAKEIESEGINSGSAEIIIKK